ncbi:unnamed protein product [Allacma fusca]|uniref:Uncharacterized protein n=1 Tax=Allacma fusca TaxID=39272 RepID=A0A8J2L960_9HEXA|nr:unnamed protein product [Allacma fusca]
MTSSETPQSLHCLKTIADKLSICSSLSNLNNNGSSSSSLNSISPSTTNPVQKSTNIANNNSARSVSSSSVTTVRTATNFTPTTSAATGVSKLSHCQPQLLQSHQHHQTNGSTPGKLTENHLSTKLHRSSGAPYPRTHLTASSAQAELAVLFHNVNPSVDQDMLDNVTQQEESSPIITATVADGHKIPSDSSSSPLDNSFKAEPNGNSVYRATDNQLSASSLCLPSSDINISSVKSECFPPLSVPSDLQLDNSGNSSSGYNPNPETNSDMPTGPSNNGMTSPGGSLDENDCDSQ